MARKAVSARGTRRTARPLFPAGTEPTPRPATRHQPARTSAGASTALAQRHASARPLSDSTRLRETPHDTHDLAQDAHVGLTRLDDDRLHGRMRRSEDNRAPVPLDVLDRGLVTHHHGDDV